MPAAELLLSGATIYPIHSAPIANGAVAIRHGRIMAVGTAAELAGLAGPATRVVRLDPAYSLLPGFVDSHQHLLMYVRNQARVSLWETTTLAQVLERVRAAAGHGWIIAVGHDQGRLVEGRHPTLAELDATSPTRPLLIYRACSHLALANSAALAAAEITADTADPPGGRLERLDGRLTGVLQESAIGLVSRAIRDEAINWPDRQPACCR
ncbi:MAG TPA: amidohydrolase family protein [Roseiflexaceae bacterium]|nr:amidohydrolase family protein [Roseiflexaceae bacterium]